MKDVEYYDNKQLDLVYPTLTDYPNVDDLRAARRKYNEDDYAITEELERDLSHEHGVENHPKRRMLWDKSWDLGHSGGYGDVITRYEYLLELIK